MGIYQIIIIVLYSISLYQSLMKHGEEEKTKTNFFRALIVVCLVMFCLYKGGFFNQ